MAVYVPADDMTDPAPATTFIHLDATTVLSRWLALRLYLYRWALGLLGGMSSTKRGGFCGGYTCEIAEPVGLIQVPS